MAKRDTNGRNLRGAVAKTRSLQGIIVMKFFWEGQMRRGNPAYCRSAVLAAGRALQH